MTQKTLIAALGFFLATLVSILGGAPAWATTDSVWADSVSSASTLAESAKARIEISTDCKGLGKLLEFGPSASGVNPSDALGDLRSDMQSLDILAATVKFASVVTTDPAARAAAEEALDQVNWHRSDVGQKLVARLRYCGNGVEKRSAN
jgi:hypothetical protein